MGTTLTGTTPQDTYDSLIKVTDNGPIGATPKLLSDGLGNDSSLALSTSFTSVRGGQQLRVYRTDNATYGSIQYLTGAGGLKFDDANGDGYTFAQGANTTMVISTLGNVGIGSAAATGARLESYVSTAGSTPPAALRLENTGAGYRAKMVLTDGNTNDANIVYQGGFTGDSQYLGIGLGSSVNDLQITGSRYIRLASGTGGIQFNGDTAAANALDDYEEGTFSPTIIGTTTAGTATYTEQNGRYTKIGRLVQFEIYMAYTGGTGTGNLRISNLPFAIGGNSYASFSIGAFDNITMTALTMPMAFGLVSSGSIFLGEMPVGGGVLSAIAYDAAGGIQIAGTYSV